LLESATFRGCGFLPQMSQRVSAEVLMNALLFLLIGFTVLPFAAQASVKLVDGFRGGVRKKAETK
jgi:hypothetical protein